MGRQFKHPQIGHYVYGLCCKGFPVFIKRWIADSCYLCHCQNGNCARLYEGELLINMDNFDWLEWEYSLNEMGTDYAIFWV